MATPEKPRRLRAADVIEDLRATIRNLTERHTGGSPQVAADFTRNAKGETQISFKLTANMEADLTAVEEHARAVLDVALRQYERATMRYPRSTGTPTEDGPSQLDG